ncbi:MAG: hypothetical protein ACD_44C00377G0001, partial [uncultured bacterium]
MPRIAWIKLVFATIDSSPIKTTIYEFPHHLDNISRLFVIKAVLSPNHEKNKHK